MLKLRVYGTPVPQGSTKAFALRKGGVPTGRTVVTSDNRKTKPWRQKIVDEAMAQASYITGWAGREGMPLAVSLVFVMPRPDGHFGTGKNALVLRPSAPPRPARKPDLDKLVRAVFDALTDAGIWRDDGQVVQLHTSKVYAHGEERPGVEIEVGVCGG